VRGGGCLVVLGGPETEQPLPFGAGDTPLHPTLVTGAAAWGIQPPNSTSLLVLTQREAGWGGGSLPLGGHYLHH